MSRTVLNPYQLPGDYAGSGSEVLDQDATTHGGPYYTGITANTMYENYRGTLVHDSRISNAAAVITSETPTTMAPILHSAGQVAEYRPRILGFSSWTAQRVQVWFYVDFINDSGLGAAFASLNCTIASTAATAQKILSTSGTGFTGWQQLQIAGQNPIIDDSAEYEDFSCSISSISGPWTQTRVEAIHIFYPVNSSALQAPPSGSNGYTGTGFVPLDDAQFTGEAPRSASSAHHLHKAIDYLDTERVGNFCGSGNMSPDSNTRSGDTIITQFVPFGVTSAKFWLRTLTNGTTTVALLDNSGDSDSVATNATTKATVSLTVTPGQMATFHITTNNLSSVYLKDVMGYWKDA
jgi:hypothetical protein